MFATMEIVLFAGLADFVAKTAVPLVTAIVTKAQANARLKAVVCLVLSGVATLITTNQVDGGPAVLSTDTLASWGLTMAYAVATYLGFWKPVVDVSRIAPTKGLGRPVIDVEEAR